MTTSPTSVIIRGVLGLSSGTVIARVIAAGGQLVLAFWLAPEEFGYWASAAAATSIFTGIANFGEVNGYLSGRGASYRTSRRIIFRLNLLLAGAGSIVAICYALSGRANIAILALILALAIPLQGDSMLTYAAGVKHLEYGLLVRTQLLAALVKVLVGIGLAMWLGTALALAVSTVAFYAVTQYSVLPTIRRHEERAYAPSKHIPGRTRFSWAINSLMMTLPLQITFFVAQFLTSPALLGLLFLSSQAALGISGLVAGPLNKVTLAALGKVADGERSHLALKLSGYFSAGTIIVCALVGLIGINFEDSVGGEWAAAIPAALILMAGLPVRIMSPVSDALQQAEDKWWQATAFNALDTIGMGLAALWVLSGDLEQVALAMTLWKMALGVFRSTFVFRGARAINYYGLQALVIIGALLLCLGVLASAIWYLVALSLSLAILILMAAGAPRALRSKRVTW